MARLEWDQLNDRGYETGIDRGVLYLPSGAAVPWNGLVSILQKSGKSSSPVYFDGVKINDLVMAGDFSARARAITFPDELAELEGVGVSRPGLFLSDQPAQSFNLSYRTHVGNGLESDLVGYKIHILYNVTAIPNDRTYRTLSNEPEIVAFEWELSAVSEEIPGYRATAHIIIDSRNFDPWLLEEVEDILYGHSGVEASLPPISELVTFMRDWYRFLVVDNGDGTATITAKRPESLSASTSDPSVVTIIGIKAIQIDEDTYQISDTYDINDIPQVRFVDNGDGTWTATTSNVDLFSVDVNDRFEIRNTQAIFIDSETYSVSDSTTE